MSGIGLPNYQSSFIAQVVQLILLIAIPILTAAMLTILVENPCRAFLVEKLKT